MDEHPKSLGPRATGLLLLLLLFARGPMARGVPPLDGTFVGARLAANAAAGAGALYNPGRELPQPAQPVESPLLVAVVTTAALLGLPPLGTSLAVSLIAEMVALLLMLHLLRARPGVALGAGVLLAASPELGQVVAGGGAGPLALATALGACVSAGSGRSVLTGTLAGLSAAAMPGAALVLPGIWLFRREAHSRTGVEAASFALVCGVTIIALLMATGRWSPAPLASLPLVWGPELPGPGTLLLLLLAGFGVARQALEIQGIRPLLLAGALAGLPWLLVGPSLDLRAAYLPLAAVVLVAGFALEPLILCVGNPARALGAVALVLLGGMAQPRTQTKLRTQVWEPLATWAAEAGVGGDRERLLASELGFTGWYAGGTVQACAPDAPGLIGQLVALQPKYLLLSAARPQISALRAHGHLARAWYPIERFSVDGATSLDPELSGLPESVHGDYLLYLRR